LQTIVNGGNVVIGVTSIALESYLNNKVRVVAALASIDSVNFALPVSWRIDCDLIVTIVRGYNYATKVSISYRLGAAEILVDDVPTVECDRVGSNRSEEGKDNSEEDADRMHNGCGCLGLRRE
jgi:hypothetical protein